MSTRSGTRAISAGVGVLAVVAVATLAAPWLAPVGPTAAHDVVATRFLGPLTADVHGIFHLLGTDRLGRDVWARLLDGARVSLAVGGLATLLSVSLGTVMGLAAGTAGPRIRTVLLTATDFALALPRVVLLLLLAALWEPGATMTVLVLGVTGWMPVARLVYAEATALSQRPHVESAIALGVPRWRIALRHVLPHVTPLLITAATLGFGQAITLEAGLSFLGLGIQPPAASWGTMIASGRDTVVNAPWVGAAPGVALVLVVAACTLIGDGFESRQARLSSQ
jgi:peptide/nickel transport system permease protein